MPTEIIGEYDIEYSGIALPDSEHWAACLVIYGPSVNPMHRNSLFPFQRVAVERVFASEEEAQAGAREIAMTLI